MKSLSLLSQDKKAHRIALYIRVSTEEQAENPEGSIRNQEDRLRDMVKLKNQIEGGNFGEVTGVYRDVLSGKDTNRPQLQRLLGAIARQEVDLILVTELSRLSRNMRDFAEMWELMRAKGCGIYSLRENFDTTTAAGEMVLYTIANIAQFERRQTAERISANFAARAQRGLYNGGPVPLGYKRDPEKVGYLLINEDEAEIVRKAFEVFIKEESLSKAARWLNDNGYRFNRARDGGGKSRLGVFTFSSLPRILRNKTYIGIKSFAQNGKPCEAKAVWPALISEATFHRAQELMEKYYGKPKVDQAKKYPFILSGVIKCGECGDPLVGRSAHGRYNRYAYYDHGWAARKQHLVKDKDAICRCNPRRISAPSAESAIWKAVLDILNKPSIQADLLEKAAKIFESGSENLELMRYKKKNDQLNSQLQSLAERLSQLPANVPAEPIYKQMSRIDVERQENSNTLSKLERDNSHGSEQVVHLQTYRTFLEGVRSMSGKLCSDNPGLTQAIIRKLVHKIQVSPAGFTVHYYVGNDHIRRKIESESVGEKNLVGGSTSLTNGGGGGS